MMIKLEDTEHVYDLYIFSKTCIMEISMQRSKEPAKGRAFVYGEAERQDGD